MDSSPEQENCSDLESRYVQSQADERIQTGWQIRLSAVEMSLSEIKALLSSWINESVQESSLGEKHSLRISVDRTMAPVEEMTCDARLSLTQKTKTNTFDPPETWQLQNHSEDVIANGIVSEDVARTSLEG